MPCYRCGAREADPARGSRLWVRAVQADSQVLVCPECQQDGDWTVDVDHCPACGGTNLVRRLGQTVCRTCESSATAEFLAVESTTDRGIAVSVGGRHRRPDDDGRDLTNEVASAIDRVLGKHAKRPSDGSQPCHGPDEGSRGPTSVDTPPQHGDPPGKSRSEGRNGHGPGGRFGSGRRR
ncbi:hypothetical protein [Phytoactinopolyspora endophytica]|uniref:hypothetical protein n=1 Tax=Phytoactinopolyspora endophytica TaxID=1642495 RepID=UPI00101D7A55|nr:hypothetical protein [Phytoactinopolyspora endophytica]